MEIGEKFLPIGTVVLLKNAKKELMITSYCIFPKGEMYFDGKKKDDLGEMFEYGACVYPEGIVNNEIIYGFNHDDIEKVCHMGYETEGSKKISELFNGTLEIYKQKKEKRSQEV